VILCQSPKPIILDVGLIKPIEWVPFIVPHQIFQIGQLYIVGVPGEFTTMTGRLKFTIQQYEGGSTLYGPHTLAAYQQIFDDLATKLARNESVPSSPAPFDMRGKTFSYVLPPIWDGMPKHFSCT
jgi:neutral ceramidase